MCLGGAVSIGSAQRLLPPAGYMCSQSHVVAVAARMVASRMNSSSQLTSANPGRNAGLRDPAGPERPADAVDVLLFGDGWKPASVSISLSRR